MKSLFYVFERSNMNNKNKQKEITKMRIKIKKKELKIKEYERINNNLKEIKNALEIKDVLCVKEDDDEYYYEEVYEIECEKCSNLIEINDNDTEVTCLNCGSIIEIDWE